MHYNMITIPTHKYLSVCMLYIHYKISKLHKLIPKRLHDHVYNSIFKYTKYNMITRTTYNMPKHDL